MRVSFFAYGLVLERLHNKIPKTPGFAVMAWEEKENQKIVENYLCI